MNAKSWACLGIFFMFFGPVLLFSLFWIGVPFFPELRVLKDGEAYIRAGRMYHLLILKNGEDYPYVSTQLDNLQITWKDTGEKIPSKVSDFRYQQTIDDRTMSGVAIRKFRVGNSGEIKVTGDLRNQEFFGMASGMGASLASFFLTSASIIAVSSWSFLSFRKSKFGEWLSR